MKLVFGSDHAGYELKCILMEEARKLGHDCEDLGAHTADCAASYVPAAQAVAQRLQNAEAVLGVLICGTGIGISVAANKLKGIRAAVCCNEYMAEKARQHNDANILALGARVIGRDLALSILRRFLESSYEGGRHAQRVGEIAQLETRD